MKDQIKVAFQEKIQKCANEICETLKQNPVATCVIIGTGRNVVSTPAVVLYSDLVIVEIEKRLGVKLDKHNHIHDGTAFISVSIHAIDLI